MGKEAAVEYGVVFKDIRIKEEKERFWIVVTIPQRDLDRYQNNGQEKKSQDKSQKI